MGLGRLENERQEHSASVVAPDGAVACGHRISTSTVVMAGLLTIIGLGVLLGFVVQPPGEDPPPWNRVSAVVGWWYFNAWAISFLPQIYLNHARKCVVGQSFDYVLLNVLGFFSYSVYTVSFFAIRSVQEDYERRYGNTNTVDANDVGFAVYAFLCCVYNSWQIYAYDRGAQTVHPFTVIGMAVVVAVMTLWLALVLVGVHTAVGFNTLDWLYGLSVVKLGVSLIKYLPQIYLNFKRKLTVGWNIWNVLLDFAGGSLSVVQQLIDCGTTGRWNGIAGNPVKFCLGSLSMIYDVVFMAQHFVLYRENNQKLHRAQGESLVGAENAAEK